jgi:hypothetical protein
LRESHVAIQSTCADKAVAGEPHIRVERGRVAGTCDYDNRESEIGIYRLLGNLPRSQRSDELLAVELTDRQ